MTEGLTKLPKVEFAPSQPAVPSIPAFAERWYLAPSPRGYYYVLDGGQYVLKQGNAGGTNVGLGPGYRVKYDGGAVWLFPPYASVLFEYAEAGNVYNMSVIETIPRVANGFGLVVDFPPTPPQRVLKSFYVFPQIPLVYVDGYYPPPAGTEFIIFETAVENRTTYGYPVDSRVNYRGYANIPRPDGGFDRYYQTFAPTRAPNPNSPYVPVQSDPPPANVILGGSPLYHTRVVNFPGAPGRPFVPPTPLFKTVRAWDAGANSIAEVDSQNVFVKFNVGLSLGVKTGFYDATFDRNPTDASVLRAAFYCFSSASGYRWSIIDDGRVVNPVNDNSYNADTVFEIRRQNGTMVFYVDGMQVYKTVSKLNGTLRVGTALYANGDFIL